MRTCFDEATSDLASCDVKTGGSLVDLIALPHAAQMRDAVSAVDDDASE